MGKLGLGEGEIRGRGDREIGGLGDWETVGKRTARAYPMKIRRHQDLEVYKEAFSAAMEIFELSKAFPKEERYSLTDQIRRSSRSVCANIAEAFRRRRYPNSFVSKLNDAEAEAAETQTWLEFAGRCNYAESETATKAIAAYDAIIGRLVVMSNQPESWTV